MNTEPKTKHRQYDEAFKRSAVEHWLVSGKSARQIADELGINVQDLPQWKQKFKALPAVRWRARWRCCKRRTGGDKKNCTG